MVHSPVHRWSTKTVGPLVLVVLIHTGCGRTSEPRIQTLAEGDLSISTQTDSTKDFSGFELVLLNQVAGDVDTLGLATTNVEGHFRMEIAATEEGVYPLIVSRSNRQLTVAELVVARGDTARISGSFPLEGRRLRIVSPENAAWMAYRNAKAFHNQNMLKMVREQTASPENMFNSIAQTSTILWSLRDTYPDRLATRLASVESLVMLEGWRDSLVVVRLPQIGIENSGIVSALRAARRSVAREEGQDSSIQLLHSYMERIEQPDKKAELHMELVVAHLDSSQNELALAEALEIRRLYPDTNWAQWASRAAYEIENLLPGMEAPSFSVVTRDGERLSSDKLRGKFLILEFYEPTDDVFLKEIRDRNKVFQLLNEKVFSTLSISLEPDSVVNDALFEETIPPGRFSYSVRGRDSDIARQYNVHLIPTRFLIDPNGLIISKYTRSSMPDLEDDLIAIIARLNELALLNNGS